ncbi:MAG: glycosyl hydrolase [Thalassotalea sp.]
MIKKFCRLALPRYLINITGVLGLLSCTQALEPNTTSKKIVANNNPSIQALKQGFRQPTSEYRPETWFHLNGNNISKAGITADLEAIKYAGMQGIHLFNKNSRAFPNVEPIKILSPEWEAMIAHVADETERLGLKLTLQNCPGWSMAGGPWVPVAEAQREIIQTQFQISGGKSIHQQLTVKPEYLSEDHNYQDVLLLAFPTPTDDKITALVPDSVQSNNPLIPWENIFDSSKHIDFKNKTLSADNLAYKKQAITAVDGTPTWVTLTFAQAQTIRSLELPPIQSMFVGRQYPAVNIKITVEAIIDDILTPITELQVPTSHWYDQQYPSTLAIPETTAKTFKLSFKGPHDIFLSYLHLNSQSRLHNHESKAGKSSRSLQSQTRQIVNKDLTVNSDAVLDLSEKMTPDGQLNWLAPAGDWTLIRFGHVNMRRKNKPAVPEATGWETSKLDKVAIENHLRNGMIGNLMRPGGPLDGHELHGLLIDSWESYVPTWTMERTVLLQEFKQRRGYDMQAFLPATIGYIVDSPEISNKFLRDLRQTMDDLFIENFFDHFRTVANDMGAKVFTEGAGGEVLPIDPMRYYGVSDYPMTEFWYPKAPSSQAEAKPIFAAASATHLYNKPFLAAEAGTQLGVKWNEHPYDLKYLIDLNFTKGINHLVFHTFSHTPQMDVYPGSSFGGDIGFPLVRTQTWWQHTPTWIDSLSRSQYLLQQGEFVADVLWYLGDELARHPFDTHPFPRGYKFDYLNEELLQNNVSLIDGKLSVKDAGKYRILMLRDSEQMLLSTAQKIKQLVAQGAIVLGDKPLTSPSLMDDSDDLKALLTIADTLWGDNESGAKTTGKGKVYWGMTLSDVIAAESIQPDVQVAEALDIQWLHRSTAEADIYYLSNQHDKAVDAAVSFRIKDRTPEVWNINTGQTDSAKVWQQQGDKTNVTLSFEPHGSQFIVFSKHAAKEHYAHVNYADAASELKNNTVLDSADNWYQIHHTDKAPVTFKNEQLIANISGEYQLFDNNKESKTVELQVNSQPLINNWQLKFTKGWDTPEQTILAKLSSLTEHQNKAIQHYSGTVEYTTTFDYSSNFQEDVNNSNVSINLGAVSNIAELWLNGEKVATRWAPPFSFDISKFVTNGNNTLKVLVTNTWRNQLIYDNQRSFDQKKTWTTNPPKKFDKNLASSGLVGPVELITTRQINL